MAHRASFWILLSILISIQVVFAMERKPDTPEDAPPYSRVKKTAQKKNPNSQNEQEEKTPYQENTLAEHLTHFKAGKTRKHVLQQDEPPVEVIPLAAHTKKFFTPSTRPMHYLQLEAPVEPKTELQKKMDIVALRNAIASNDIREIQELLSTDINPNAINNRNNKSTLHLAASLGRHKILELLLDHPLIQLEAVDQFHHPPLLYAITQHHPLCIGALLHRGAWVGPDTDNYTIFHRAVEDDTFYSLLAFFVYCINPKIPIPEPLPPIQLPANNNGDPAQEQQERDPLEVLDEIIEILYPERLIEQEPSRVPSLQTLCIQNILGTHVPASKMLRCDILAKLWGRPLAYRLPCEIGESFAQHMDFNTACTFIASFSPNDHQKIAEQLAWHYAKVHLKNINRLLRIVSSQGQTPLHIALARNRSSYMQALVNPLQYITHLNVMLKALPILRKKLSANPLEQDPLHLFYHLFVYRLLGGVIVFNQT